MRRLAALLLLAAAPALAAAEARFLVGARVVSSARVSAEVRASAIHLTLASRGAGEAAVQVGSAPAQAAPGSGELTLPAPAQGDVTVTLLY